MNAHRQQSQAPLLDQLSEVILFATQHGYYDAADWIGARLREATGMKNPTALARPVENGLSRCSVCGLLGEPGDRCGRPPEGHRLVP